MSKALSGFELIPGQSELWSAQKGSVRCTALKLRDGSLCLYSPVLGLGDGAKDSLAKLGEVSHILAPNHYHHKGLREYSEVFPKARIICSEVAHPRLAKQTGLSFEGLQTIESLLPIGCKIAAPDGLKTGEVWLVVTATNERIWIVCDSFKGPNGKVGSIGTDVGMLGTFPTFGIKDAGVYVAWIEATVDAGAPSMIIPCHGSMVRSEDLAADILSLPYG